MMRPLSRRHRAQALIEAAAVLPLLLVLALGSVGTGRLVQARMQLDAVSREAARAAVLAPMPSMHGGGDAAGTAHDIGVAEGQRVADGYNMGNVHIDINFDGPFGPGSWVNANASRDVDVLQLILGRRLFGSNATGPNRSLHSQHWERVDRFRSLSP